jgi:AraC-like DNA-binding protein
MSIAEVTVALLLDTDQLDARDRIDAVNAVLSVTEVPHVILHTADGEVHHQIDVWELGPRAQLVQIRGTAIRLIRGPRQLRVAAPERVSLGFQLHTAADRSHLGSQESLEAKDLVLTDVTSAFTYGWVSGGGCRSYVVDYDMLGLSVDAVRRAVPRLKQSPLYTLLQSHLGHLAHTLEDVTANPAAGMLGAATTELLRALIVTAADEDSTPYRETLNNTLLLRIKHYVEHHLTEATLNVESIAAAHHVSVRRIYQVWASNELSLGQWIIRARLEGARRELARPGIAPPIAVVARRWGFADPTHFGRRFRTAYGLSPREWKLRCTQDSALK